MKILKLIPLVLLFIACKPNQKVNPFQLSGSKILCLGEGTFGWGNADFTLFNENTKQVTNGIYKKTNGTSLGDVLQSGIVWGNQLFLVINNSNKIVVLDTGTLKVNYQLLGFSSPRYLQPINDSLALVTELYINKLHLLHKRKGILKSFWVNTMCEKMDKNNQTIAIACKKGFVYFYNTNLQKITDSVTVNNGCGNVVFAQNNWYAFANANAKSYLYIIQNNKAVVLNDTTNSNVFTHVRYNPVNTNWVLSSYNAVYYAPLNFKTINQVYNLTNGNFYGLGINPKNGDIYIANAPNYTDPGNIICLNNTYNLKHSFTGDVIPSEFVFMP